MQSQHPHSYKHNVHKVLAHSYAVYFVLFLVGVYFDLEFQLKVFKNSLVVPAGFILLVLASLLIFWAQRTSRNLTQENIKKESFLQGPYRYTRSPTHWGLFMLLLGFGLVSNALFVILFTFIALLISKFIFLPKEETILAEKYGSPYLEYKKSFKL